MEVLGLRNGEDTTFRVPLPLRCLHLPSFAEQL